MRKVALGFAAAVTAFGMVAATASADPRPPAPKSCTPVTSAHMTISGHSTAVKSDYLISQGYACDTAHNVMRDYFHSTTCHHHGVSGTYCIIGDYKWSCHTTYSSQWRDYDVKCGYIPAGGNGTYVRFTWVKA